MDMPNLLFQKVGSASYNPPLSASRSVLSLPGYGLKFSLTKEAAMLELTLIDLLRAAGALAIVLGAICLTLKDDALDQGLSDLD
jgi:hypothetical protein